MSRLITFSDWMRKMRDEIWPSGYPENALNSIRGFFVAGCMDMQRTIECLQENNATVASACSTFFNCGMTWLDTPGPRAAIKRIYTIANGDWTNKVFYHQHDFLFLADWSQNILHYTQPLNVGLPKLPLGDRYIDKLSDSKLGRARRGVWALNRKRVYLAPWIQSNETVIIEWDGVRVDWKDDASIDQDIWDPLHEECLKLRVKGSYERDFGDAAEGARLLGQYDTALALLINDCTTQLRRRNEEGSPETYSARSEQTASEKLSTTSPTTLLAVIGEYGSGDANEQAVANMVAGWNPAAVITTGGNATGDLSDPATWDTCVGQFYQRYIFPYAGIYGQGAEANQFWPALGVGEETDVATYAGYFQSVGMKANYDVVVGNVHFFFLSGVNDVNSDMATWLRAALALSTVRWKVVICPTPPYSGDSEPTLFWPFKDWGAHLVISGKNHNYERLSVGFPYIIIGSSGKPLETFSGVIPPSVVHNGDKFAALQLSASCATLHVSCIAVDGTIIDTLALT